MAAPTENSAAVALATDAPTALDVASAWSPEALLAAEPVELAARLAREEATAPIAGWIDEQAAALVTKLKDGADRHWLINPNRSLEMADAILRIGRTRGDTRTTALGIMARADAMKLLGHSQEAWNAFQEAGRLFLDAGDEVGWARTRIGRLSLSIKLNRITEAFDDVAPAREILARKGLHEFLVRLEYNVGNVQYCRANARAALAAYDVAKATAESLAGPDHWHMGWILTDMGQVHADLLGDYHTAFGYFQRSLSFATEHNETKNIALADLNIAWLQMQQGHYRQALQLLYNARVIYDAQHLILDANHVNREIVECYIQLNRFADARDLARAVIAQYHTCGEDFVEAHALLNLATAEAELRNFDEALKALSTAERLFVSLGAEAWAATVRLRRGRILLRRGEAEQAYEQAAGAATCFETAGYETLSAAALALQAEALLECGIVEAAKATGERALRIARVRRMPLLLHDAHLVLGRAAEAQKYIRCATRHYRAASAVLDRVQRGLTLTLRPGFLMDKGEAIRRQLAIYLNAGDAPKALEVLERAKSQAFSSYLTERQRLRWKTEDPETRKLMDELERLRDQHRWLFRIAHEDLPGEHVRPSAMSHEDALGQLAQCERRMRAVTEQLYLNSDEGPQNAHPVVLSLLSVHESLDEDSVLVEFYHDESTIYAFTLGARSLDVHTLPASFATIERLIAQLQLNIATTLRQDVRSAAARLLRGSASRLLEQLFAALLEPVVSALRGRRRLYIVPFGILHYLPFHLLRVNGRYLIEDYEVVVLPSAGLLTRSAPVHNSGARIVAHSANGLLPQVLAEAAMVHALFSGDVCLEEEANREAFEAPPTQILHVAAHAAFRLDQPDLSYIELADGQLYADDLMQQDLSYELVTLSACETGRAHVAPRDELIGLGRGFLYAGAGALIASLWRVADDIALPLMRSMYEALRAGASKAAALRSAQSAILAADPDLHPAYWGPFQLTGDAGPLSSPRRDVRGGMLREEVVAR